MTNVGLGVAFPYVGDVSNPLNHRWSLGLQRELPGQFLVEATYVGAKGVNLPVTRQLNGVPLQYLSTSPVRDDATNNRLTQQVPNPFVGLLPGTGLNGANVARSQLLRPYPQFTSIQATETNGRSDYNALQARVERRMANGFTVQVRLQLVADDDRDGLPERRRRDARARDQQLRSRAHVRVERSRRAAVRARPALRPRTGLA